MSIHRYYVYRKYLSKSAREILFCRTKHKTTVNRKTEYRVSVHVNAHNTYIVRRCALDMLYNDIFIIIPEPRDPLEIFSPRALDA